jgi:site-specific DNA-methyltransferase (adenine-specific)
MIYPDDYINKVIQGDCLEVMKGIPDKSIDIVLTDPPYNIGKAEWDKITDYVEWCGTWIKETQRVLKNNGSFYFFHNDMEQIPDLMTWIKKNSGFIFKRFIVWNKKFNGARNEGFLQGFNETGMLRNYQQMAEYCLFYTFQDETGLTTIMLDTNNFTTLRQYFKDYQEALGLSKKEIVDRVGQQADHCFRWGSSQWDLPTKETYQKLSELPTKYEFIRREYEDLRREYEDLRYTFNNQKTHHSIWNYEIENGLHPTQKPVALIGNVIKHSSNEGDLVLDMFGGSGTTAVACKRLNRNFILIEKEEKYCQIARQRLDNEAEPLFNDKM